MGLSFFLIEIVLSTLLLSMTASIISAQSTDKDITDFPCSASPCKTYITYRTQPPDYLDLGQVSDLFGVSRLSIMKANNLPSEDVTFFPDQLIFVPILCGCTGNRSFVNTTYEIKPGDSFYLVSIGAFENLTDYQVVQDSNPMLIPTSLEVGQEAIFPIYCRCPSEAQSDQGFNFLLTYVWQRGDDVASLSRKMNTSSEAMLIANNYRNFSDAIAFPILIPVSSLPQLPSLYYNTSSREKQNAKSNTVLVLVSSLLGSVLASILLSFLVVACCKRWPQKCLARITSSIETAGLLRLKSTSSTDQNFSPRVVDKLLTGVTEYIDKPVIFETRTILEATINLDQKFRISTSIYKAVLCGGEVFAVKPMRGDGSQEVNILRKVNHANLVKLIGISTGVDGKCFLVYEFVENESLDKWLYPETASSSRSVYFLSWTQRLMIALDVANGLQYLHEHTTPSIVHRDIRTRSILLNSNFKAKISNFSNAQPASNSISPLIDIFGFGIVLLELLSGRRAVGTKELLKEIRVVFEAEEKVEERLRKFMDSSLGEFYPMEGALSLASVARACTSELSSERPRMCDVVLSLSLLAHSSSGELETRLSSHSEKTVGINNPIIAR